MIFLNDLISLFSFSNNFINLMSVNAVISRQRAQSTVSLRKRLIRANSEEKVSELKKSSTMTSFRPKLERLIQQGKIEQIMNSDPSSKAHLYYTNHVNEMEKQLASTKKSLSSFVIKSRTKQQSINTIKNDIRKVEREIQIIRQEAALASKRYTGVNDDLMAKKTQNEIIYWNEKMCAHMRDRGYKDEVFLKGKYEGLQRQYDVELQNKKLLEDKYHELKKINKDLSVVRNQARVISDQQARDKTEFIQLLEADMSEREMLGELKAEKHKRQGQINEIAATLIEKEELERILEVLYAHRILSQIIRTKSTNLLKKYQDVNRAYNHIKSNSNIVEPDKILKRMEEHDTLYDDALKRVSALEGELNSLEKNLEDCLITKNEILSTEGHTEMYRKGYYQGLQKDKYQLLVSEREKLEERKTADEVLKKNILSWSGRMFSRFGINQSESNNLFDCLTDLVVRIRQQK